MYYEPMPESWRGSLAETIITVWMRDKKSPLLLLSHVGKFLSSVEWQNCDAWA